MGGAPVPIRLRHFRSPFGPWGVNTYGRLQPHDEAVTNSLVNLVGKTRLGGEREACVAAESKSPS